MAVVGPERSVNMLTPDSDILHIWKSLDRTVLGSFLMQLKRTRSVVKTYRRERQDVIAEL